MFNSKRTRELADLHKRSTYLCEVDKIEKTVFLKYRYGTSGFRGNHKILSSVMVRVGLLASLRSAYLNGQAVGIVITASHNREEDNGVKIIDPSGEMLCQSWEQIATDIANLPAQDVIAFLEKEYHKVDNKEAKPVVFVGRDTRPHSLDYSELLIQAAASVNADVTIRDFGTVTTPQMHYLVRKANMDGSVNKIRRNVYLENVISSFLDIMSHLNDGDLKGLHLGDVIIDCANGVGGLPIKQAAKEISKVINMNVIHLPSDRVKVNHECGAEHIHKKRLLPAGLQLTDSDDEKKLVGARMASVDGDCDRLMYFSMGKDGKLVILDGDKQICLLYSFLRPHVDASKIALTVGVVQTAYANGSSTAYIRDTLGTKSIFTATGVKHLHHEAKKYDIGIYFEANGHGTILFSDDCIRKLNNALSSDNLSNDARRSIQVLLLTARLSNQAIGDALADLLLVEVSLFALKWTINDWNAIYIERPASLTAMRVKDRHMFETTNAEQTCVKPIGLQNRIDELTKKYSHSRSFVRPSGTEDVVRVYAEAETEEHANVLNLEVRQAVFDIAGGVGQRPVS